MTDKPAGASGPFEELLRLQSNFQQKLAEETLNYLRQLQGMVGPVVPGTLVVPKTEHAVSVSACPGERAVLQFEASNRQRVHCLITPMLSPLVDASGTTWFAEAKISPSFKLLPADGRCLFTIELVVPKDISTGNYQGACLLYGYKDGAIPVHVAIRTAAKRSANTAKKAKKKVARKRAGKKTAKKLTKKRAGRRRSNR